MQFNSNELSIAHTNQLAILSYYKKVEATQVCNDAIFRKLATIFSDCKL